MGHLLLYVVAALLVATLGIDRKFGFWGYFFGSLALTPLVGLILVMASDPKRLPVEKR
jgi:hypothetical protein